MVRRRAYSRIAARCRSVGNKPAECDTVVSKELVDHIEDPREPQNANEGSQRACEPKQFEDDHSSACIAGDRCAIAEYEPPAFPPSPFRHRPQQLLRLNVR
jgi:hypothetical protein